MRMVVAGIGAVLALALAGPATAGGAPDLTARAAILMDAATGEVLFDRNASEALPPASTTKVMTAVVALESGRLDETFGVTSYAAATAPSKIGLRPGQRMGLRHLLYALMLKSANDAATVVAEGLGGSEARFAARMTARAHELGARSARFANAHGLTAPGHVASARDLAVIFRHALGLPLFREVLETHTVRVPVQAAKVQWVSLRSHNRLLTNPRYPVIGKTGYTRAAGRCFVGAAQRSDRELIVTVLGSKDLWGDTQRLLAWGYDEPDSAPPVQVARRSKGASGRRARREAARAQGDEEEASADSRIARYAVRLGPFGSRQATLASRAKLARGGYSAVVHGRTLRLGRFASQTRAEQFATRLRRAGWDPVVVLL